MVARLGCRRNHSNGFSKALIVKKMKGFLVKMVLLSGKKTLLNVKVF